MDATSRFPIEDAETLEQIVRLSKRQDFGRLRAVAAELEDKWAANFARGVLKSRTPVDQSEIDRRRGFYDGIDYILRRFPAVAEKELERLLNDTKESE